MNYRPFSRATWTLYLVLASIRVFIALSPGYIHPDEFFQSAEITAGQVFGIENFVPWEYNPELPCRSILVPSLTTGLPFWIARILSRSTPDQYPTSYMLFIVQRLAFVLFTFIIDWAVVGMARHVRRSPSIALLLMSSSYVTLAYHTHPFSNSVETLVLALCGLTLSHIIQAASESREKASSTGVLCYLLGVLFAVGSFTRITFVLYGFPLGVMLLYVLAYEPIAPGRQRSRFVGVGQFIQALIPLTLGILSTISFFVIVDSFYFGKLFFVETFSDLGSNNNNFNHKVIPISSMLDLKSWRRVRISGSLVFTVLNNILYNVDKTNLAEHGLHPLWFHLGLNFPVLYGNLAFIGVGVLYEKVQKREWTSQSKLVTALTYSGLTGIGLLSVMPHQEARFLTPLILSLVIPLSSRIARMGRRFWPLWLVFNGVLALVFGLLHQGGIVPSLQQIQKEALGFHTCSDVYPTREYRVCSISNMTKGQYHGFDGVQYSTRVIFYKTYMPPQHLFGYSIEQGRRYGVELEVLDWRQKDRQEFARDLKLQPHMEPLRLTTEGLNSSTDLVFTKVPTLSTDRLLSRYERVLVVAPSTVDFGSDKNMVLVHDFFPHANFDHLDVILQRPLSALELKVYILVNHDKALEKER